MKSILITGCSSGIGLDAARLLGARGWRVLATCRRAEDCAALEAEGLESFVLDHANEESVRAGCAEAISRAGSLDAVFINGAYALAAMFEDVPRGAMREIMETNLLGPQQIITELVPHFRDRGAGRIVLNSSVLGLAAIRYRGPYVTTKFAMEGMADVFRMELRGSGVHVSLIEPGPIPTEIRRKSQPPFERWINWEGSRHRAFYERSLRPRLYDDSATADTFERPVSAVTRQLVHAIEHPRPKARYFVTPATPLANLIKRLLPTRAADAILSRS